MSACQSVFRQSCGAVYSQRAHLKTILKHTEQRTTRSRFAIYCHEGSKPFELMSRNCRDTLGGEKRGPPRRQAIGYGAFKSAAPGLTQDIFLQRSNADNTKITSTRYFRYNCCCLAYNRLPLYELGSNPARAKIERTHMSNRSVDRQSCPNPQCDLHGQPGKGNIIRHSFMHLRRGRRRRYLCKICGKTFCSSTSTPYYRLQHRRSTLKATLNS